MNKMQTIGDRLRNFRKLNQGDPVIVIALWFIAFPLFLIPGTNKIPFWLSFIVVPLSFALIFGTGQRLAKKLKIDQARKIYVFIASLVWLSTVAVVSILDSKPFIYRIGSNGWEFNNGAFLLILPLLLIILFWPIGVLAFLLHKRRESLRISDIPKKDLFQ